MITHEQGFKWRGDSVSRLEAFSDTVFGFAISLLVVSLEVPKTFSQLMAVVNGFPAFAVCFALIFNVWYQHFRFFRRYALQTTRAILITAFLLFFVLFYVYPLKFLFSGLLDPRGFLINTDEARLLFVIYGFGYAAISLALMALYWHAWTLRVALHLTALEQMKTRHAMVRQGGLAAIGAISAILAVTLPSDVVGLAGYFYIMIGVYLWAAGAKLGRRERALLEVEHAAARERERLDQST